VRPGRYGESTIAGICEIRRLPRSQTRPACASGKPQEIVSRRSFLRRRRIASSATGSIETGEHHDDHSTQDHARTRRLYLNTYYLRERVRARAGLTRGSGSRQARRAQKSAVSTSSSNPREPGSGCAGPAASGRSPSSAAIMRMAACASDSPLKPSPTTSLLPSRSSMSMA
jgi:hypothetical protein